MTYSYTQQQMNLRNIQLGGKVQGPEGYKVQKPGKLNLCEGACDKTCKRGRRRREEDTHTVQETASKRQGLTLGNAVGEEQEEKGGRRPQMELGY